MRRGRSSDGKTAVGMYIEQVCIAVLFFLKISDGLIFIVEGALMVLLIGLTLTAQILFQRSFDRKYACSFVKCNLVSQPSSNHTVPPDVACYGKAAGAMGTPPESASRLG